MKKLTKLIGLIIFIHGAISYANVNPPVPTINTKQSQSAIKMNTAQQTQLKKEVAESTCMQKSGQPHPLQKNTTQSQNPPIAQPKISLPIRDLSTQQQTSINQESTQSKTPPTLRPVQEINQPKGYMIIDAEDEDITNIKSNQINKVQQTIKSQEKTNSVQTQAKFETKTNTKEIETSQKKIEPFETDVIAPKKENESVFNKLKQLVPKSIEKKNEDIKIQKEEPTKNSSVSERIIEKEIKTQTKLSQDKLDEYAQIRDNARVLYNANEPIKAKEEFNKIPDAEKTSDDWLFLGNIAIDENKLIDAVFYYKKAIQIDDSNFKAHFNLGNLYLADNKTNMALSEYKKVLKTNKDYSYAHYNMGCCYLKNESYINARYSFGLAIRSNPHEPAFYYNLAYTNKKMGKAKKAQEALEMYNKLMSE